jgi:hypothetical protein
MGKTQLPATERVARALKVLGTSANIDASQLLSDIIDTWAGFHGAETGVDEKPRAASQGQPIAVQGVLRGLLMVQVRGSRPGEYDRSPRFIGAGART